METVKALAQIAKQHIDKQDLPEMDRDMAHAAVDLVATIMIGWIETTKNIDRIADALERGNDLVQSPVLAPVSAPPTVPSVTSKPLA